MTDITIELEDLIEAWRKSKCVAGITHMDRYIKSITPEPEWERPALVNALYLGDGNYMREKNYVKLIKQVNILLIMESLWKKFGDGHGFKSNSNNYYPEYNHESKKYQWELSFSIQAPNIYYYNKMVTEVSEILTKLKVEGVI